MIQSVELAGFCDEYLQSATFRDYAPNGLQIQGKNKINKIVTGVTACQALIDAAVLAKADALIVHHGFFWKGESSCLTGIKGKRISTLVKNDINLFAYHLPLDAHAVVGNNAQLSEKIGLDIEGKFGRGQGDELAMYGRLKKPKTAKEFSKHLTKVLGREPLHLVGESELIERVAWCSGAAQSYIEAAEKLSVQAFISGEVSEATTHFVRESGVHYFAAGHHATERYGVKALGELLAQRFDLIHEFIDIPNPV